MSLHLYSYFRSSASWRVRIALALKGLHADYHAVHLVKNEHQGESYRAQVPAELVPALRDGDTLLTQSLAILEYLDETHPEPPLLPGSAAERARVRSLALDVACDIHPLQNLRVLRHLTGPMGHNEDDKTRWVQHWIARGLQTVEARLVRDAATGLCAHGDAPTLADCVLVPQLYNARRFDVPLDAYPTICRIEAHCLGLSAFAQTAPAQCPDAT